MARARKRPGWYPDPEEAARYRWWSGTGWTPALADSAEAPPAPPGLPEVAPGRRFPWIVAVIGGLVVVVLAALTGIGLVTPSRWPTIPSPSAGTPQTVEAVWSGSTDWDRATLTVTALEGRFTMPSPNAPWTLVDSSCKDYEGLYASACAFGDSSFTQIGPSSDPKTTPPLIMVGVLEPDWVGAMNVKQAASAVMEELNRRIHKIDGAEYTEDSVSADTSSSPLEAAIGKATVSFDLDGVHHVRQMTSRVIEVYPGAMAGVILVTDDLMTPASRSVVTTCFERAHAT